ncbi:hypothetical protein F4778DRAFT_45880 [Xylariomycetidae sp. FL2044]|nr:hypothetical protein F4778DRAFT_45880 [Xylariomycetidae sp. FL2044]
MKSAVIFFLSAMGSLAAAAAVPADDALPIIDERGIIFSDKKYYGSCKMDDGPGICGFQASGQDVTKPCGVNYKCKFEGEACTYNPKGDHAHCNL